MRVILVKSRSARLEWLARSIRRKPESFKSLIDKIWHGALWTPPLDFESSRVTLNHSASETRTDGVFFKSPKRKKSGYTTSLPALLIVAMKGHQEHQQEFKKMFLRQGTPLKTVSERLGPPNATITLNTYAQVMTALTRKLLIWSETNARICTTFAENPK